MTNDKNRKNAINALEISNKVYLILCVVLSLPMIFCSPLDNTVALTIAFAWSSFGFIFTMICQEHYEDHHDAPIIILILISIVLTPVYWVLKLQNIIIKIFKKGGRK